MGFGTRQYGGRKLPHHQVGNQEQPKSSDVCVSKLTNEASIGRVSETPPLGEEENDDDNSSGSEMVLTPPSTTPINAFQAIQRIRSFQSSPGVKTSSSGSLPRRTRRKRHPQFVVPNPLDHKPSNPTPVWKDPFADRASNSGDTTIIESMETDEEPQARENIGSKTAPIVIGDEEEEEEEEEETEDERGGARGESYFVDIRFEVQK